MLCGSANHYDITPILNSPYDTAAVYIPLDSFSPPITLKIPVSPINGNVVYGWVMGHIHFENSSNQILQDSITDFEFTVQNTGCHSYFEIYPTSTSGLYSGINMSTGTNLIYHWEFGDGDTSNLPYPTHLYANPGHYCVSLTVKNAVCCDRYSVCDSFSFKTDAGPMIQLVITGPTGLTETETESRTIVFPNPATNQLTINLSGLQAGHVSIYNVDGKLLSQTQQPANNTVDVNELAKGIYVAEVKVKDAVQRVRWVKM